MRWLLLLQIPMALQAQVPDVPVSRRRALSSEEAKSVISGAFTVYHDSVVLHHHRLKPDYSALTGIVYSTRKDGTLNLVKQYTQGQCSGSRYTLDPQERVTEVVDYFPDTSHRKYWYDVNGRLQDFCHMRSCADDAFDRIFGSWCPGACWAFDTIGRVSRCIEQYTPEEQTQTWYYTNGQMAERRWHSRNTARIEQWCRNGKRIAISQSESNGDDIEHSGNIILWSIAEYSYYMVEFVGENMRVRSLPRGRWESHSKAAYRDVQERLELEWIKYQEPKRPVELPCDLPKR